MTSPNNPSNFEYSDDSVVARLSFDVPPQALTDVTQLTQALSAMATQQEYIARSTGSWLDYMQQVPQIMERANQAYRESITQLERMSYIQNEMSAGPGGNISPGATAGPQAGGYSTAAPAGYINPFAGQFFGMGQTTPDLMGAQQQMASMAQADPRMYANMMAARGQAVNPALLGMVGGAAGVGQGMGPTGGGQGWGNAAPGSQSPQATQTGRDSSAPPVPTQSGAPSTSEPQFTPATPHADAPAWQKAATDAIGMGQQVVNEAGAGGGGGRAAGLLGMASAGMGMAGKLAEKYPNLMGGNTAGRLASLGKGAGAVGLGAAAMGLSQNIGEKVQQYEQLGAVQGGGAIQGAQYEAQARMLALNPFITTEQARSAMQMALSAGFKGGEYDTVMDYMLKNFKDMGVQFSTSKDLITQRMIGGESAGEAGAGTRDLLETLHALSAGPGASFNSRQDQAVELTTRLTQAGVDPESAARASIGLQQGYGDNMALRESITRIGGDIGASPQLMQLAASKVGVNGLLPGALQAGLAEAGYDNDELVEIAAGQIAEYVKGYPERLNRIAAFQALMAEQGVQMSFEEAEAMYDKVTGEKKPTETANENIAKLGKDGAPRGGFAEGAGDFVKKLAAPVTKPLGAIDNFLKGDFGGGFREMFSFSEEETNPDQQLENMAGSFAGSGRAPKEPPSTPQDAALTPVRTEGQVSGEVRITVDQAGRVSAPPSIQLSGQQKSANAGYGSAQLNNAPPGDPAHGHAYNAFPGG